MEQEAGGHRIQRVPPTERKGRVHTSTVTVSVLDFEYEKNSNYQLLDKKHFKIEWFSGTGKGGQKRNKTQSCCRIIHEPTGIMETRQGRSRNDNYQDAYNAIINKLKLESDRLINIEKTKIKKDQIGSGMRGDKIRTYRFQDDFVTDHLTGKNYKCSKIMKGEFEKLWKED